MGLVMADAACTGCVSRLAMHAVALMHGLWQCTVSDLCVVAWLLHVRWRLTLLSIHVDQCTDLVFILAEMMYRGRAWTDCALVGADS